MALLVAPPAGRESQSPVGRILSLLKLSRSGSGIWRDGVRAVLMRRQGAAALSIKDEIHALVDQLGDDRAVEILALMRRLVADEAGNGDTARTRLSRRMRPAVVSGRAFFAQQPKDLPTIAAEQGVKPVARFDDLLGDFWPEDETADEFIATVRRWRREGGYA
jgi:hypothetical protein